MNDKNIDSLLDSEITNRTTFNVYNDGNCDREQLLDIIHERIRSFENALNNNHGYVLVTRLSDDKIITINDAFKSLWDYSTNEFIGRTTFDLGFWQKPEDREKILEELRKHNYVLGYTSIYKLKNGFEFYGIMSAKVFEIEGEKYVVSITHEQNDQNVSNNPLSKNENLYKDLVENSEHLFWQCDASFNLTYLNKTWKDLLGYNLEEMIGQNILKFASSKSAERDLKRINSFLKSNSNKHIEMDYICKNGEMVHLIINAKPIISSNCIVGLRGTAYNITERKKAEAKLTAQKEQLHKLLNEKDRFISIIAHDLKSPFQGLLGLTELLSEETSDFTSEELMQIFRNSHNVVNNLFNLLKDLFEWAQIQQGTLQILQLKYSLISIVESCIEKSNQVASQKNIKIINAVPSSIDIYADKNMVSSVICNLISNAVKFSIRGGSIIINAKTTDSDMVEIGVVDNGIGMSKELQLKLFKIHEKVGRLGTEGEDSAGLGLLLCKGFIDKHGGKIWIESEEGKGSAFYFTLPDAVKKNYKNISTTKGL